MACFELAKKPIVHSADEQLAPVDVSTGRTRYDAYFLNQQCEGRPLVVYLGLGTTALTAMGQTYLRGYAAAVDHPVITLQPRKHPWKSVEGRAESDSQVLAELHDGEIDIVGASSGGLLAAAVAGQLGPAVKHLITVSSVGTKHGYGEYIKGLPGQFLDGLHESVALIKSREQMVDFSPQSSNFFHPGHYRELAQTIRQSVAGSLADSIEGIDDGTKWDDVVGGDDHMTDYKDHLALVRQRNQRIERQSSLHLLGGKAHMWATNRQHLAQIVSSVVSRE